MLNIQNMEGAADLAKCHIHLSHDINHCKVTEENQTKCKEEGMFTDSTWEEKE